MEGVWQPQDILSASREIKTGLLDYEPLIVSNAYAVTATTDVIAILEQSSEVLAIHPNYTLELPSTAVSASGGRSSNCDKQTKWHHDQQGVRTAHQKSRGGSVKVAVLDSGLDISHPEFDELTLVDYAEWDGLGNQVSNPSLQDTNSHGTHVTGILCGKTVGIAPDVKLYVGTVAPQGRTQFAQLSKGLDWAAGNGVDIINLSLGKPGIIPTWEQDVAGLEQLGILLVAAVGNDGVGNYRCPGNCREALAVGAVDANNNVWATSRTGVGSGGGLVPGPPAYWKPDLYAPGVDICSCVPQNDYDERSGTSMATAVVTAVAALVKNRYPTLSSAGLLAHLKTRSQTITVPPALGLRGLLVSAAQAV